MMDIQKEPFLSKDQYECLEFLKTWGLNKVEFDENKQIIGITRQSHCDLSTREIELIMRAWQAKSKVVPEGFMLVKKRNVIGNPKVDWLQAPKWAKYWLKDGYSNKFWWCSNRPKLEEDYFLFYGRYSAEEAPSFGFNGDWKKSMTSRKAMLEAQEQSHE